MKRSLDFQKIKHRLNPTPISSKDALKNVTPIDWSKSVTSGDSSVELESPSKINEAEIGVSIKYV